MFCGIPVNIRVLLWRIYILLLVFLAILLSSCRQKANLTLRQQEVAHTIENIGTLQAVVEHVDTVRLSAPDSVLIDYDVIVLLSDSNIVIANRVEKNLVIFSRDGRFLRAVGRRGNGPGEFQDILCASAGGGRIYVYDHMLQRISVFGMDGSLSKVFKADVPMSLVRHMAVGPGGEIYFHHPPREKYTGFVSVVDSSGKVKKVLLEPKNWSYKAYFERGVLDGGIQLSRDGVLFETNTYSYKISKVYPDGRTEEFGEKPENYRGLPLVGGDRIETPEQLSNLMRNSTIILPYFFLLSANGLLVQNVLCPVLDVHSLTAWYYIYDTSGVFLGKVKRGSCQNPVAEYGGYLVGLYPKYGSPKYGDVEQRIPYDIILYKERRF